MVLVTAPSGRPVMDPSRLSERRRRALSERVPLRPMTSEYKEQALQRFDSVESELRQISRWMFDHPELGYQEFESSRRLVDFLRSRGFEVEYPAYGMETAFAARTGTTGPEVVICAEYDALPEIGHACGHNLIATAAVGAGHVLSGFAGELGIKVTVLGTPAEEQLGGKIDLIEAGAFSGAAAALMVHPATKDVLDPRALAVVHLDLEYHGKAAHAAATPQVGINALDAFVQAYVNVATLRQHFYPTDKVHCIITRGGTAPNIIPDYTRSSWYIRAATMERLDQLSGKVSACFEAAATATGCTWDTRQLGQPYAELISHPLLSELFDENARALGRQMMRGSDLPPGEAGSTDMGNVSQVVPSLHPMLDIHSLPAVNHQAEFAAHTITPAGEQAIRDGALGMAWTVIDLAEQDLWDGLRPGTS